LLAALCLSWRVQLKQVVVGNSLNNEMALWRYMSIDKFIDLISNRKLFLTPLSYYQSTDPFEGFSPKVAFEAITDISLKFIEELEEKSRLIEKQFYLGGAEPTEEQSIAISNFKSLIESNRLDIIPRHNKISKSTCVHCWYHSESESEAMWKLYSDSGKGIAIKTSVGSLVSALNSSKPEVPLRIGRVKYLDFLCEKLTPKECVTDGVTTPLLKRNEYAHENEIRLFSVPIDLNATNWREYEPTPTLVDVDLSILIESVYISPYVTEPFISSVKTLCKLYEIPNEKIIQSQLLKNYEKLLCGYVK